ncbi:hypothetical protein BKA66DRAFT_575825 [Pyrenochaeta sp. MPI-SDFR-AT-0127]|nr:hypothetical protein BKA66DRAFT_575825 [Pyrenochaeta sp. MPI-SDFR-AT-0127]
MAYNITPTTTDTGCNGHRVFTAKKSKSKCNLLCIHITGRSLEQPTNQPFRITQSSVETLEATEEVLTNVQDHSWFKDVDLFTQICQQQPVPGRPGDEFTNWVHDVLGIVRTQHGTQWQNNNANFV